MATTVAISMKIGQYSELFVIFVRNVPPVVPVYNGRMASMATKQDFMLYPIGIQNFEDLRKGGYIYVDKTEQIHLYLRANIIS